MRSQLLQGRGGGVGNAVAVPRWPPIGPRATSCPPSQCITVGRNPLSGLLVQPVPAYHRRSSRSSTVCAVSFFGKMFKSDPGEATRKKYQARVDAISSLEPAMQALSDDQLRSKTEEFKRRVQGGEPLDALLVEVFAVGGSCKCTSAISLSRSMRAVLPFTGSA